MCSSARSWLSQRRAEAFEKFSAIGFPTLKNEAWRYTNLNPIKELSFQAAPTAFDSLFYDLPILFTQDQEHHRLVFINGRYQPDLGAIGALPKGVKLGGLAQLLDDATTEDWLNERLTQLTPISEASGPLALNAAHLEDGVVLHAPCGTVIAAPIEIVFVSTTSENAPPTWRHPRLLIVMEANSQATVIEHHVGYDTTSALSTIVSEITLGAGARLFHYKLQNESPTAFHLATAVIRVERDAAYDSFILTQGASLSRSEQRVILDGPGAACQINGATRISGRQVADVTTSVDHAAPHCVSRQTFKAVIGAQARSVFQGRILVRPGAQKTDGQQLCRGMLLSTQAEFDAKPELEIHADDVKCSHGASVGALDQEALFYLRSRGLDQEEARTLLVDAFINDVIEQIQDPHIRDLFNDQERCPWTPLGPTAPDPLTGQW
ncbi:Fe-S cluster assembly protein SufD [Azospirillaceae bacterium]